MTVLLNSRAATVLFHRLNATRLHQFKLYSLSTNFRYNNSKICPYQIHSLCSSAQSTRSAHSKDSKKWQLVNNVRNENFGESVYKGKYVSQIMRVKLFSMMTSIFGASVQPMLWQKGLEVSGVGVGITVCSLVGIFTFVTPVLLHLVVRKYVFDILYNKEKDEYTAITISPLMFRKMVTFKVDDITVPEVETMFTSIHVGPKKIPMFVDSSSFTELHHYERFMGYDKPFNFIDESKPLRSKAN